MRGEYFLALPVMATLFNVLFALVILQSHHSHAHHHLDEDETMSQECIVEALQ